jgi:SpoIID/LytB domain protein
MKYKSDSLINLKTKKKILLNKLRLKNLHAIAGIGNPDRFFNYLKVLGMVFDSSSYQDHYQFTKKDFKVIHFQELLGEKDLKSTEFSVQYSDNVFSFVGYGEGPGTGLCLYSAQEMAKRGKNAAQILDMFFPESRITFMDIKKE